jgi:hypothetical protein
MMAALMSATASGWFQLQAAGLPASASKAAVKISSLSFSRGVKSIGSPTQRGLPNERRSTQQGKCHGRQARALTRIIPGCDTSLWMRRWGIVAACASSLAMSACTSTSGAKLKVYQKRRLCFA